MAAPCDGARVNAKGCFIPGVPALPRNSAYSDHRNADTVPSEMSVSMVAVPCRRLAQAARWNGHAAHTTTGAASVSDAHCQYVNCSAGIIAIATTGTVRTAEALRRCRSDASSGSAVSTACGVSPDASEGIGVRGVGSAAV